MKQALYKLGPCKHTRTKRKHQSKIPMQRTNLPETARELRLRRRIERAENQMLERKTAKQRGARAGQPLGSQAQDTAPAAGLVGAASMQLSTARAGQPLGSQEFTYSHVSPTTQVGDLTLSFCKQQSLDFNTVVVLLRLDPEHEGTDPILKENGSLFLQSRQQHQARELSSGSQPADDATLKELMELRGEKRGIVYVHVKRPGAMTRVVRMQSNRLYKLRDAYCEAESLDKRTVVLFRELNATETGESPILDDWVVFHAHIC